MVRTPERLGWMRAAAVLVPALPVARPGAGPGPGVRVRAGGVQRRAGRPAGRTRSRAAVPQRHRLVGAAHRLEEDAGAGLAEGRVAGGAAAGAGGPERGLPELL